MNYEMLKSKSEALELLEADLITVQTFINICRINRWQLDGEIQQRPTSIQRFTENMPEIATKPAIRLVYSNN